MKHRYTLGIAGALVFALSAHGGTVPIDPGDGTGPIGLGFAGTGTIQFGPQTCLLFVPDGLAEPFAIASTDGFSFGDRVYITGEIQAESNTCFPFFTTALVNTEIFALVEDCGTLTPGPQGCANVTTESSGTYPVIDGALPDLGLGNTFRVQGYLVPDSNACFPIITTGIVLIDSGACIDGDINLDGAVNFADLSRLLQDWGSCSECRADINDDGSVGFEDLATLLSNFGMTG